MARAASGQAVPAQVREMTQAMAERLQYSATTDATGHFVLNALDPGQYVVLAQRDGYSPPARQAAASARAVVSLAARESKTDLLLQLEPMSVIAGRVQDESGDPVRRAQVTAMVYQYSARGKQLTTRGSASTNDLGEYRMFDLPPGKYYVKASPVMMMNPRGPRDADEDVLAAAFYPGVLDPSAAVVIETHPGEELRSIDLVLRRTRGVSVRWRVVRPAGAQGPAIVRLVGDTLTLNAAAMADQGAFEIRGVTPGTYELSSTVAVAGKRYSGSLPVQVGAADIEGLELRLQAPLDLNGVVRMEGNSSLGPAQARVMLEGSGRSYSSTANAAKQEGGFTIRNVDPGVYRVTLPMAGDFYVKSVRCGSAQVGGAGLDLSSGVPCDLSVTLSANAGQIDGAVERDSAAASAAVFVTLVPAGSPRDPSLFRIASADSSGEFHLRGIAPGAYRLFAWEDGDVNAVRYDPDYLKPVTLRSIKAAAAK
jgi:hypothetical protein